MASSRKLWAQVYLSQSPSWGCVSDYFLLLWKNTMTDSKLWKMEFALAFHLKVFLRNRSPLWWADWATHSVKPVGEAGSWRFVSSVIRMKERQRPGSWGKLLWFSHWRWVLSYGFKLKVFISWLVTILGVSDFCVTQSCLPQGAFKNRKTYSG